MFEVIDAMAIDRPFHQKPDWSKAVLMAWPENVAGRLCVAAGFCRHLPRASPEIPTVVRALFQRGRVQFAWMSATRFPAAQVCFARRRHLLAAIDSPVFSGHKMHLNQAYYV